jgi:hypothetical protein
MALSYFKGRSWQQITREERVFCAELEGCIRDDEDKFVAILQKEAGLPNHLEGPWEVAYEACFYRDYLHCFNKAEKAKYSTKRTFDLVLFSEKAIIIIEAKAAEAFSASQAQYFKRDRYDLARLLGKDIEVYLVALASQVYFGNYDYVGRGTALRPFEDRRLTWQSLARHYPGHPLLERASEVYERSPLAIVDNVSENGSDHLLGIEQLRF